MKKVQKFPTSEELARVPSQASASKTWDCAIVADWLLCFVAGEGGLHAGSVGGKGGAGLHPCLPPPKEWEGSVLARLLRSGGALSLSAAMGAGKFRLCLPPRDSTRLGRANPVVVAVAAGPNSPAKQQR